MSFLSDRLLGKQLKVVIGEQLLIDSIHDDLVDKTGRDPDAKEVQVAADDFTGVAELRLSFKRIDAIDHLKSFRALRVLALDNNCLTHIANLEPLVNLEWLDLSFNSIVAIEGLETLTKLTDLTLFSNKISKIQNLKALTALQCFSIGDNEISEIAHIISLRSLPALNVVNMKGNPVCDDQDYVLTAFAFLKNLKYLDYELVDADAVAAARENKRDALVEMEELDTVMQRREETATKKEVLKQYKEETYVHPIETLMGAMFAMDTAYQNHLKKLPFVEALKDDYEHQFKKRADKVKMTMLVRHKEKVQEEAMFQEALRHVMNTATEHSIATAHQFASGKQMVFEKIHARTYSTYDARAALDELKKGADKLVFALMKIEMDANGELKNFATKFDRRYKRVKNDLLNTTQLFFEGMDDLEKNYAKEVAKGAAALVKEVTEDNGCAGEDLDEDVLKILLDQATLASLLQDSTDKHTEKTSSTNDALEDLVDKNVKHYLDETDVVLTVRHRGRVDEIQRLQAEIEGEIATHSALVSDL